MRYIGIEKIEKVIISHNDIDHLNVIPEIVKQCKTGGIYADDAFFENTDAWGTAQFLQDCLSEDGFKIENLDELSISQGPAELKLLWPNEKKYYTELSENDKSLVISITSAGRTILLCSDIEKFTQAELLRLYPDLDADVVVVPHHGSINTLDKSFIDKLNAKILICSCNRRQYEAARDILTEDRAEVFYTHRDGAVTLRIDGNGKITTETFIKSPENLLPD
jgi:competence protein ComEC